MTMRLIIVSGLSGSGKSVALHMLEDIDFYCVDNIPAALLKPFISHTVRSMGDTYPRTAVGLDARNRASEIETIPALVAELRRSNIDCEVLYLHAADEVNLPIVTRLKDSASYGVVENRPVPENSNVVRDEVIVLVSQQEVGPEARLRRIEVWVEEKNETIVFVTNNPKLAATTIARIYKERWQIELFFISGFAFVSPWIDLLSSGRGLI